MSPIKAPIPSSAVMDLHWSLLSNGDGEIANEMTALLLATTTSAVRRRLPRIDPAIASEAAEDAILKYLSRPAMFDPAKCPLDQFLGIVAVRMGLDRIRREKRRRQAEVSAAETISVRPEFRAMSDAIDRHEEDRRRALQASILARLARTPDEAAFLAAKLAGEHRTEALARVLRSGSMKGSTMSAKRDMVKRVTERLRIRARRIAAHQLKLGNSS